MTGPCLCGDTYCPSCGGADPAYELVCEWLDEAMDWPACVDGEFMTEHVAQQLGQHAEVASAVEAAARDWARRPARTTVIDGTTEPAGGDS